MKTLILILMALTQYSAHAQTVTTTTVKESGIPFWDGRPGRDTEVEYDAIGLKLEGEYPDNSRARDYLSHVEAHGKDEAECSQKLFNQSMTQTDFPDLKLKGSKQDHSFESLLDRGIMNLSGFSVVTGKAVGADGNEFPVMMKLNFHKTNIKKVRSETRSGKVLSSTEENVITCHFNKGGVFGHSILLVKNKAGTVLVKVRSYTVHGPGMI